MIEIDGTAIQVGDGKLATCAHVVEGVNDDAKQGYVLTRNWDGDTYTFIVWPFDRTVPYIDPRSDKINPDVDLAVIPVAYPDHPPHYDVPDVRWGDSTRLGVGDSVVVGGYPYGTELFRANRTNRGVVQPTFYPGIVSSVIPATSPTETRLLQISVSVAGGISGGGVFNPNTGALLGMVTSGLTGPSGDLHPVTYAIPSEVIAPFASSISFKAGGRTIGKEQPLRADGSPLGNEPQEG